MHADGGLGERSPTGKVFSDEDLAFIAALCVKHNAYAVCDEARPSAPVASCSCCFGNVHRCLTGLLCSA